MDLRSIYSLAPARGWLPWGLLAPFVCLVLAVATEVPAALLLEHLGAIDANGDTIGAPGLMAMLIIPFLAWGTAVLAWVLVIERRPLATIGLIKPGGVNALLSGHFVGVATISAVV